MSIIKNLTEGSKKYQIIYADPPWRSADTTVRNGKHVPFDIYPTMPLKDICALPVSDLAHENCALFLWTTDAMLLDTLEVFRSWEFSYKTVAFIWVKTSINGKLVPTLRPWTAGNAEICLLGIRGKMQQYKIGNQISQVVYHPRMEHSKKPDSIRRLITKMFPTIENKIELFARNEVPGWDSWGNQLPNEEQQS